MRAAAKTFLEVLNFEEGAYQDSRITKHQTAHRLSFQVGEALQHELLPLYKTIYPHLLDLRWFCRNIGCFACDICLYQHFP